MSENEIRLWLNEYLRTETKLTELVADKPLFQQIDSFEVVGLLLSCAEKFSLGESLGGDVLTPMTLDDIAAFIAARAR